MMEWLLTAVLILLLAVIGWMAWRPLKQRFWDPIDDTSKTRAETYYAMMTPVAALAAVLTFFVTQGVTLAELERQARVVDLTQRAALEIALDACQLDRFTRVDVAIVHEGALRVDVQPSLKVTALAITGGLTGAGEADPACDPASKLPCGVCPARFGHGCQLTTPQAVMTSIGAVGRATLQPGTRSVLPYLLSLDAESPFLVQFLAERTGPLVVKPGWLLGLTQEDDDAPRSWLAAQYIVPGLLPSCHAPPEAGPAGEPE